MREIKEKNEVNEKAVYYRSRYEKNKGDWEELYDSNFNHLEDVKVHYTNAIAHLRRIEKTSEKDRIHLMAYDLTDIGNGFMFVDKDEYTSESLKAIAKTL